QAVYPCSSFLCLTLLLPPSSSLFPYTSLFRSGMKRGSLVFCADSPALLPTFRYDCRYRPVFLSIYLRRLKAWGFSVSEEVLRASWHRYSGDLVSLGKGGILARVP